jgi:Ca-activated chloride channel homolog
MYEIYGLISSDSEVIPLKGVKIEGDIFGCGAKVQVFQLFRNQELEPVEAVYKFPLPEGAAICGFKIHIDGREIHGELEERDKAFEIYDDALSKGDGGYLLDQEKPNIFTLSVGSLSAGSEVLVAIEFVTLLDTQGSRIRFFLPTTISPRYIPDGMPEDDGLPVDAKIHPPYAKEVPYGLSIFLNVHDSEFLASIESPSHHVKIDMKSNPLHVSLSSDSVKMDRDFILNMEYAKEFISRAYHHRLDGNSFIQLDLMLEGDDRNSEQLQKQKMTNENKEIIFVVDCSGSMAGDSIREAKKALEVCLRAIYKGTKFNIYRFGSTHESLFDKPAVFTDKSLEKGLTYLRGMDANLGGTNIRAPLQRIYARRGEPGDLQRDIILLTDGEVANEEEIFQIVGRGDHSARLFSLGIGAGCNEYFIKGLSRVGRGQSEFIYPGERIEPKVLKIFGKVMGESLTNPVISWGRERAVQAPAVPVIFFGNPLTVFAKCKDGHFPNDQVIVKGNVKGKEYVWTLDVKHSQNAKLPVPVLWARERIRDLEEDRDERKGSKQTERKKEGNCNNELLMLSKRYGLLSRITAFVAIEEREEMNKETDELVLRKIPVPLTVGWHGAGSVFGVQIVSGDSLNYSNAVCCRNVSPDDGVECCYPIDIPIDKEHLLDHLWDDEAEDALDGSSFSKSTQFRETDKVTDATGFIPKTTTTTQKFFHKSFKHPRLKEKAYEGRRTDILMTILSDQRADGGMEFDEEIASFLSIELDEIKRIAEDIEVDVDVDKFLLLSTALLLGLLDIHFADLSASWKGVVKKSRDWYDFIEREGNPKISKKGLTKWTKKYVKNRMLNK